MNPGSPAIGKSGVRKALVGGALVAALLLFGREAAGRIPEFVLWVRSLGVWGPVVFVLAYGAAAVLLVPGALLTIAAGAVWGLWPGALYAVFGAALGSTLAFLSARYLVRRHVQAYISGRPRLAAIDRGVAAEGVRLVLLLRLSPIVPFILLNYVLGVSRITFAQYTAGTIGMLPAVMMYVYAGKVAGDVALAAEGVAPRRPLYFAMLLFGFAATAAATMLVARAAQRSIESGGSGESGG